jgi:hypothetical protein
MFGYVLKKGDFLTASDSVAVGSGKNVSLKHRQTNKGELSYEQMV